MVTLALAAEAPPALTRPVIVAPAPREVSFGRIQGRIGDGTTRVVIRVDGVVQGDAVLSGNRFQLGLDLPARDVTIRVTALDASGNSASSAVTPVYGLPRAARPHALVGSLDRTLQRRLRELVSGYPGIASAFVQNLRTGKGAAWNARARFQAASTVKLGIAIEVLRVLTGQPKPGSRVARLLYRMIVYSDNAAANELEVWLGGSTSAGSAKVTATFRALGLDDTFINGGFIIGTASTTPIPLNILARPPYFSNGKYTTAWDLARIHRLIHRGAAGQGGLLGLAGSFTAADARYLLWVLAHVQDPGKLDRYVSGPSVSVLHKAGWISTVRHDSGIVYWQRGAFVAVVMTYNGGGAGPSSDVLAGHVAAAALRRFSETGRELPADGRLFRL
ncbi:MAG: serine hydrolase [Gaiellaceae bacterium]